MYENNVELNLAEYMYLENAQYNALNNAKIECTSLKKHPLTY